MVYFDVLRAQQRRILEIFKNPRLAMLWQDFYLAGGTGFSLQLGHRVSVDFDFFMYAESLPVRFATKIKNLFSPDVIIVNTVEQFSFVKDAVNITFLAYPFKLQSQVAEDLPFKLATIHDITAAKAYAIGRRAKWKDYVDIFVYIKLFGLAQLVNTATTIFQELFSEKLFFEQLCYFDDIDFSEEIIWNKDAPDKIVKEVWEKDAPPTKDEIQQFLCGLQVV